MFLSVKRMGTASVIFGSLALNCGIASADVFLSGAGATFPQPFYERMVAEYNKLHPNIKIDYQGIGSGGGIKSITEKTVDYAGSDAPLSKKEITAAGGADNLIEIPSCAGGVVPAYNVPGLKEDLKFSGEVLADIYMGTITKWNDAKITALNPGVDLPDMVITPAWRTDGSGTNFVFTNYLCTQSNDFKDNIGMGKQVEWPLGQGGKGNEGVAAIIQRTKGAIGYIEQGYADKNHIQYGSVKNKAGKFLKATPENVSKAGEGAVNEMKGHVISANIWNQDGDDAYPIASFTYLVVYKDLKNIKSKEQAQVMVDFLDWAIHDGQKYATDLDYAPLSDGVAAKDAAALAQITYKGESMKPSGK